jgi:hypothetical protein
MAIVIENGINVGGGINFGQPPPSIYTTLAGSLSFNGSNQYLSMSPGVSPAAGAFTIEGWFYNNSDFTTKGLLGTDQSVGMSLFTSDDATITLDRYGGGYQPSYTWPAATLQTNKWQYIVINRNASTDLETMWIGTFVNDYSTVTCARATGASGGTSPSGGTQIDNQNWGDSNWVGRFYGGYFPGYITNFRVTIGAAVYNSNNATITAPTAPLTAGANTEYLMLGAVVTTDTSGTQTVTNNGTVLQTATKPF